jgi:enterochelin esterase-like enzyme
MPEYAGEIHGRFVERWFFSQALERDMRYFVYLPPHYDVAQRVYPTLYLLHGASGEAEEWVAYGFVTRLDQEIAAGTVEPYLAVLPEGEFGYWINHAEGGYRWGDYVVQDLVAHVDGTYRTLPLGPRRAIGGLSMGGSGGLVHAFTHPTIFGVVGAHSPSMREDNSVVTILGRGAEFAARDPVSLARTAAGIERVRIWIDLGTEDQFRPRAEALQAALRERGVPHQWTVWPGYHSEEYWTEHVPDYVRYYGQALHGS